MNKLFSCSLLMLCSFFAKTQPIISIAAGTVFSVQSKDTLCLDSLVLIPSSNLSIPNLQLNQSLSLTHSSINSPVGKVFNFSAPILNYSGNVLMLYTVPELNGVPENQLIINNFDGSTWQSYVLQITRYAGRKAILVNNLSDASLNELALSSVNAALPVRWGQLTGNLQNGTAILQWTTFDEAAVAFFQVQKSNNAYAWSDVGNTITPANKAGANKYFFTDNKLLEGDNYYRVKQIDVNGRESFSANFLLARSVPLVTFSNNILEKSVTIQSSNKSLKKITVINSAGQIVSDIHLPTPTRVLSTNGAVAAWTSPAATGTSLKHTLVSASPYSVQGSDDIIGLDVSLNGLTVTLPAANSVQAGKILILRVENGDASVSGRAITITRNGSDLINYSQTSLTINQGTGVPGTAFRLFSDGVSHWWQW